MKKTYILAALSILFWSTAAAVSKALLGSFSQYQLLCVSALFACTALLWVFLFLHEPIAPTTLLGLAVIVMGILIQLKDQKSR